MLILLGALRVWFFCLALPIFNNVDEAAHFDLVERYSRFDFPGPSLERYSQPARDVIVTYGSPEYVARVASDAIPPRPIWRASPQEAQARVQEGQRSWAMFINQEVHGPPLYYALAGLWDGLGRVFGLSPSRAGYWARFLNVPLFAGLLWLSLLLCGECFTASQLPRLGVPLLLAFFPQSIFYSINSDLLSAVLVTGALLGLARIWRSDKADAVSTTLAAGFTALAVMNKPTNISLLLFLAVVFAIRGRRRDNKRALGVGAGGCLLPPLLLAWRNLALTGDLFATRAKVALLGWTPKPLSALTDHPLFTLAGAWYFLSNVVRQFWRGELLWHFRPFDFGWADSFFLGTSLCFCLIGAANLRGRRNDRNGLFMSQILGASAALIVLMVGTLAGLSLLFDFGRCYNPSRAHPFFVSGRLIAGGIVPFLILFVQGLDVLCAKLGIAAYRNWALLMIAGISLTTELSTYLPALTSPYNFFHLP